MPCAIKIEDDKANYKLTFYLRQLPSSIVEVACERVSTNIVIHVNIILKSIWKIIEVFLFVKMLVESCATNFELHNHRFAEVHTEAIVYILKICSLTMCGFTQTMTRGKKCIMGLSFHFIFCASFHQLSFRLGFLD